RQESATAFYFDGSSSRRRVVRLVFGDALGIGEDGAGPALWTYDDIRQVDSPAGVLRVSCLSAPALARLEIRDAALSAELASRCARLGENRPDGRTVTKIVGWSVAAVASIVMVVLFAIPLAADRLAPLVPQALERRIGEASEVQIRAMFGKQVCDRPAGQAAYTKLLGKLREAAGLDTDVQSSVLSTEVPNAFALPGGKVYMFSGLLAKAENPDELAGALIFASRSLVTASYSREAEQNADSMTIEVMQKLGRSPRPMGELLYRITGKEGGRNLSILAGHPLTEDRLQRMSGEDRPASGPPLLTPEEWTALKAICGEAARK